MASGDWPWDILAPWRRALGGLEEALRAYAARLGDGGGEQASQAADSTARRARELLAGALGGETLGVFEACGRLAAAQAALENGAAAASAPEALAQTEAMSRSWHEAARGLASELGDARVAATAAAAEAGARLAEGSAVLAAAPTAVAAAYFAAPVSAPGAALFAALLVSWGAAGVPAAPQLGDDALAWALGLAPDTPEAAKEAASARSGMHPLEALGLTYGFRPGGALPEGPGPGMAVLDATLPQARAAVRYSLPPLLDPAAAAAYGPLAAATAGLSEPLVRRLRTISAEPLAAAARPAALYRPGRGGLARTIDGGATFHEMVPRGPLPPAALEVLGAGPRPRVARLGELLAEALEEAPAARLPDAAGALARHSANPDPPLFTRGELEAAVLARLPAALAGKLPDREAGVRRALLGEGGGPAPAYLVQAVAAVARAAAEKETATRDASGDTLKAALFGSRSAARQGGAREAQLSALLAQEGALAALRRALYAAYEEEGAGRRAARALEEPGEAAGRLALQELARVVVRRALAPPGRGGRVDKQASLEPARGFKAYCLAHPPLHPS